MATKKEKRLRGELKAAQKAEERRQSGLAAQRKDKEARRRRELDAWQEQHDKKHSWKKRIKECPHCQIEIAACNRAAAQTTKEAI